jgi:NodT family efflux transporter outer membrane factor (OMF) lipoprotein
VAEFRSSRWAAGPLALLVALGCAVGPNYVEPAIETPDRWQVELTRGLDRGQSDFQTWWTQFEDPVLTSLIERATDGSLDIRLALARINAAAARRGIARGEWFPSVDAGSTYQRTRLSEGTSPGLPPPQERTDDFYSVGVGGGWEIDVFGRVRRSLESATADLDAAIEDYRDVLVVLYAQVGIRYVNVRTLQERIAFNEQNIAAQRGTLQIVRDRSAAGLVGDLDLRQAEENLGATESLLPRLRQLLVQEINRLSVLLGLPPSALHAELAEPAPIPGLPAEVLVGLPYDLLRQRPDIRAAERQLAAQTARIGVATADLYPRFSLLGTFAFEATDFADWGKWGSHAYSLGPKVIWNIFDGGRIRSNIRVQEALTEQALVRYERTVLDSLEETESAMIAFVEEQNRRDALERSATASAEAVELVQTLYRTGLTNFQNVLDTERSLFGRQDQLAESRGLVAQDLIAVYRALGGGWGP